MIKNFAKDGIKLACAITHLFALLFLIYSAVFVEVKNERIVDLLTGGVLASVGVLFNYYFGTSQGSARKTDIIAEGMMQNKT